MNVVVTCQYSPWSAYSGGGQRSTHQLATALARRGHRVTVLFSKSPLESVQAPGVPYELAWCSLWAFRSRRHCLLRPLSALGVARYVERRLRGAPSDLVVHSNGEEGALLPLLRRQGRRFAFVVTPRYPALPRELLVPGRVWSRRARLLCDPKYAFLGYAVRGADFCVPPSRFGAELIQRAFHLPSSKLCHVHNGCPSEFLDYTWDEGRARHGPIVFLGQYDWSKGIDVLLEAMARLGRDHEDLPHLHLYGRGTHREQIHHRVRELGLGTKVHVGGWVDHDTLGRALAAARFAVLPSREENFSLAVLAALAVGTPTIATPVGGTPELIEDGHQGLLVPPGDPAALASAMSRLLSDDVLARALGAAGRKAVRDGFTWDRAAERFEELYGAALDRQRQRG